MLSSELSRPCCPRLVCLAHSGPSRGQQARARGGPGGCEECAGPPSKAKYWGTGRGGDTNPAPLPPNWSLPHGKMGAPGEVGEERAPLTTSVDSHFSMSSMRQAWVTGIWRGGQGPSPALATGEVPSPSPSLLGRGQLTHPTPSGPKTAPAQLPGTLRSPRVLPVVPGCGRGGCGPAGRAGDGEGLLTADTRLF